MTDTLEAARAFVAAGDALNSPEHAADVEKLRDLSNRVREREAAYRAAQEALFSAHEDEGREPHPNAEARAVINGDSELFDDEEIVDLTDMPNSYPDEEDEYATAKANGALS